MTSPCCHAGFNKTVYILNFFRTPFFLPWLYPALTWRMPATGNEVYITFDDGPVPGPTEFVLRELDRVKANATFFVIGDNAEKYSSLLKETAAQGNQLANHTFNHLRGWKTGNEEYELNVRKCEDLLTELVPDQFNRMTSPLFRPPYGRITRKQIARLSSFQIIMWDVLTHDYAKSISPEQCLRGSLAATRPGSIVVFHDSLKAEKNLRYVLPRYLDQCAEQGFTFKTLA